MARQDILAGWVKTECPDTHSPSSSRPGLLPDRPETYIITVYGQLALADRAGEPRSPTK